MAIALKVPAELDRRLKALAKKTHRSKSYYVREALVRYIEELEDEYLAKVLQNKTGSIYSLEEVKKILGLND